MRPEAGLQGRGGPETPDRGAYVRLFSLSMRYPCLVGRRRLNLYLRVEGSNAGDRPLRHADVDVGDAARRGRDGREDPPRDGELQGQIARRPELDLDLRRRDERDLPVVGADVRDARAQRV